MEASSPARGRSDWAAYAAACLALGYAAVSLYWALGGRAGLATVGGYPARMGRDGSAAAAAVIWTTVALKVVGAVLALALVPRFARRLPGRPVRLLAGAAAVVLTLYGGVLVGAGALVETGVIRVSGAVDWRALRWHIGVWDLWFLLWGLLLALAVRGARREPGVRGTRVRSFWDQ
jgi:hypothetical protein